MAGWLAGWIGYASLGFGKWPARQDGQAEATVIPVTGRTSSVHSTSHACFGTLICGQKEREALQLGATGASIYSLLRQCYSSTPLLAGDFLGLPLADLDFDASTPKRSPQEEVRRGPLAAKPNGSDSHSTQPLLPRFLPLRLLRNSYITPSPSPKKDLNSNASLNCPGGSEPSEPRPSKPSKLARELERSGKKDRKGKKGHAAEDKEEEEAEDKRPLIDKEPPKEPSEDDLCVVCGEMNTSLLVGPIGAVSFPACDDEHRHCLTCTYDFLTSDAAKFAPPRRGVPGNDDDADRRIAYVLPCGHIETAARLQRLLGDAERLLDHQASKYKRIATTVNPVWRAPGFEAEQARAMLRQWRKGKKRFAEAWRDEQVRDLTSLEAQRVMAVTSKSKMGEKRAAKGCGDDRMWDFINSLPECDDEV
ncbi:hypothetical protein BDY21DRAFT_419808 [Lineolata rhizophorae]|uniref:Uncharacterized protein n=1 Tax=Lineolata rhizophorae TaxID=578093 RepID=A0A6A6P864_9PEZI|nr:hypothetical protein BDY21DRAFT_419808 [Lineolata rhizophorae]